MSRVYLCVLIAFVLGLGTASFARADKQTGRVEIQTNQKTGTIRFMIDGKPIMVVDAVGLHVDGDITYSGLLTDGLPQGKGPTHAQ